MNILLQKTELEGKLKVMLKVLLMLAIIAGGLMFPFVSASSVYALENCNSRAFEIKYTPSYFATDAPEQTINFTTNDPEVQKNLSGQKARLSILKNRIVFVDQYELSDEVVINDSGQFSINISKEAFLKPGKRQAVLELSGTDAKSEFKNTCDVLYKIGDSVDKCYFDPSLPKSIPPGANLPIKFVGNAETDYYLYSGVDQKRLGGNVKTDKNGRGIFSGAVFNNASGNEVKLQVKKVGSAATECEFTLLISIAAPQPSIDASTPIPISNTDPNFAGDPVVFVGTKTLGSGQLCKNNTGVITALGCIPNNPETLITSLIDFLISIGGMVALVIMAFAAIQMMIQGSDAKALQSAQQRFVAAAIGLTFLIFSVFILRVIGVNILQIPGFS